jgi:hypothetical protein
VNNPRLRRRHGGPVDAGNKTDDTDLAAYFALSARFKKSATSAQSFRQFSCSISGSLATALGSRTPERSGSTCQ